MGPIYDTIRSQLYRSSIPNGIVMELLWDYTRWDNGIGFAGREFSSLLKPWPSSMIYLLKRWSYIALLNLWITTRYFSFGLEMVGVIRWWMAYMVARVFAVKARERRERTSADCAYNVCTLEDGSPRSPHWICSSLIVLFPDVGRGLLN